ncbi:hypothetical protein B4135_1489 [Caldibacillus debilis]|uniref:YigZ family protein n=1 Tax=Caldibacillus debilis TaxID=301148 RepID=A0A150MC47_9BACI|nr:hypothetical protein B4135_1489 [Caldibacillus debilis]
MKYVFAFAERGHSVLSCYYTVKGFGTDEIVIQKSRFIAYVDRAESEEKAYQFLQTIKKKHWDATHNCSAFIIGEHDQIQRANDDGEPSGTAGIPMLEVLKKRRLKNTVVVVTRYFGGIKLGAGGLVRAYSRAASSGIDAAGVVERKLMRIMHTFIDYSWLGKIENELRNSPYPIKDIRYFDRVEIETYVEEGQQDVFRQWMTEKTNGQALISEGETDYVEREIVNPK